MSTSSTSRPRKWNSLLQEDRAQAVLASVQDIAAVLQANLNGGRDLSAEPELGGGTAGIAIFFGYLHTAGLFAGARDIAFAYNEIGVAALAGQPMGVSLYGGFTGVAWAVQHLHGLLTGTAADLCSEIDLALEGYLSRSPWREDYDLINGLVGIGIYCLERVNSPTAVRCMELIVERLAELAETAENGLRWFTSPSLFPQQQGELYPRGYYNLGLAHGVPGIIALLGRTQAAGIAQEKVGMLLEGAVRWVMRQQLADAQSSFASVVCPEQPPSNCRLAWCYGDAGVAAALFLAARCTGERSWEQQALVIARKAAAREPQTCGVVDACFCHGSAGLAHVFHRFYRATQEEVFSQAARHWIESTLAFRKPGEEAAGYLFRTVNENGGFEGQPRLGILEGIAGIGLSLLAAVTSIEPCWDRILMVDIPPLSAQP